MKKIFLLLIILLLPILVDAKTCDTNKVKIKSIEMINKSEDVVENNSPSFKDLTANVDLKFNNKGDYIEYRIIVKNDNDNDFELQKSDLKTEYFDYYYIYNDNSTIVKANSEKQITFRIEYSNLVPEELKTNFVEKKEVILNLSNDTKIVNPQTSRTLVIGLILILLGLSTMIFTGYQKETVLLIIIGLFLPIGVYALCNVSIKTNTTIGLNNIKEFCFYETESDALNKNPNTIKYYKYEKGMHFDEYLESDYNIIKPPSRYNYYFNPDVRTAQRPYQFNVPEEFIYHEEICDAENNCKRSETDIEQNEIFDKSVGCYTIIPRE